MENFNEWYLKPTFVSQEMSNSMRKRLEKIFEKIHEISKMTDIYETSLQLDNGELTIHLVMDYVEGWWNGERGLFDLIDLVDSLRAYTDEKLSRDLMIVLELKIKEKN